MKIEQSLQASLGSAEASNILPSQVYGLLFLTPSISVPKISGLRVKILTSNLGLHPKIAAFMCVPLLPDTRHTLVLC